VLEFPDFSSSDETTSDVPDSLIGDSVGLLAISADLCEFLFSGFPDGVVDEGSGVNGFSKVCVKISAGVRVVLGISSILATTLLLISACVSVSLAKILVASV